MLISSCPTAIEKGLNCICTRTSQTSVPVTTFPVTTFPVTTFSFGNNSQTQRNDIWTSNTTNTSAVGSWSTSTCAKGRPSRNYHKSGCSDKPFSWKSHHGPKQNPSQIGVHFPFFLKLNVQSMIVPKFLHEIEAVAICFAMERGCR